MYRRRRNHGTWNMDPDPDTDTDTQPWPLGSVAQKKPKKLGTWRQHFAFVADIKMLKISICYKGPEPRI